jgi:D-glycero-D-manno-heptose 1,7-bisphosphate phosphatase
MTKTIILDRDGVINEDSDAYIKSPDEWLPIPGSLDAIARLKRAGFRVVVATNQSGVARGYFDLSMLQQIHRKMLDLLQQAGGHLDGIFFCPHGPDDHCDCRKPRTGLFQQIAEQFRIDLTGIPAIGDSLRDLQAAEEVGAQPILVLTGKGEKTLRALHGDPRIPVYRDLAAAVDALLQTDASGDRNP